MTPPACRRRAPSAVALLLATAAPGLAQIHVDDDAQGADNGKTWQDAYTDLQDALAAAQPGDAIWVAEGTYRPSRTGDRHASFVLSQDVVIHGGFLGFEGSLDDRQGSVHRTLLSGDLNGDDGPGFANRADNSLHVVFVDYFQTGGLDRVTVRGGHADVVGDDDGGGLLSNAAPEEVAVDCVFRDNFARRGGGAYTSGIASFHGCTFLGNRALVRGGGLVAEAIMSAAPYVERCRFLGNEVVGGGADHQGGGLYGSGHAVVFCEFSGNRAPVGGGLRWIGEAWGLTVSRNTAGLATGGALLPYATLRGSVLWGNVDPSGLTEQAQVEAPLGMVNESCVQGWTGALGGARNQHADPLFEDPPGPDGLAGTLDDDLDLRRGSPCIDRGAHEEWLPGTDVRGRPRLVDALHCGDGGVIDMGANERQAFDGTSNYCDAAPSSLGAPARLFAPCSLSLFLEPVLELKAEPVPDGFGVFLVGPEPGRSALGGGVLCLGSPRRLELAPALGGVLRAALDLTQPPAATLLVPGSTWFVQALYRDGGGFNLSDAASLEVRP